MALFNPRVLVGVLISAACLYFVGRQINVSELIETLSHTNPWLVILTLLGLPPAMYLKVVRWRLFFPKPEEAAKAGLLPSLYIGYMVNTVAPLRMGELVRAYLVGHHDRLGVSTVLATIVLEKLFDVASLIIMLLVLMLTVQLPDWAVAAGIASTLGLVFGVACTVMLLAAERPILGFIEMLEKRYPFLNKAQPSVLLSSFVDGLRAVREPSRLLWIIIWSAVLWLGGSLTIGCALLAVGIPLTAGMLFFLVVVSNLGMSVPSAPGYVGVYHALVVLALGVFGVAETTALSAGIVLHTVVFGFFLVAGVYYLWRGHYAFSQLLAGARETAEQAHAH